MKRYQAIITFVGNDGKNMFRTLNIPASKVKIDDDTAIFYGKDDDGIVAAIPVARLLWVQEVHQ